MDILKERLNQIAKILDNTFKNIRLKSTVKMDSIEYGQNSIDELFANFQSDVENFYLFLDQKSNEFQTFDLLSNIAYYNNSNEGGTYSDSRGDRSFISSEAMALLCLKKSFNTKSIVTVENYQESLKEIQDSIQKYCERKAALKFINNKKVENTLSDAASLIEREATMIRNLGLPDHHLMFSKGIFAPIKTELENIFGFSIDETIKIRHALPELINKKCDKSFSAIETKLKGYLNEIILFRKYKSQVSNSIFSKEQLEEFSGFSNKHTKEILLGHLINEAHYNFSDVYTFSAEELAEYSNVNINSVKAFLRRFSCGFPSLGQDEEIYAPVSILKTRPILEHNERYLLPSFPLIIWAVEDVVEEEIKNSPKLQAKYIQIKHNFLLEKGLDYFKKLLPTAKFLTPNLFYNDNGQRFETDALLIYDKVLFIIEAKGNRITSKAKKGHELSTSDYLKNVIRDSYFQGIRTLQFIQKNPISYFETNKKEQLTINKSDFDDIVIVSLALEPIGNLSMTIKATNEIGFFKNEHFPWIISIYDLAIIADLFDNPILFMHYIKRRKHFLSHKLFSIHDEIDLVAYFLNDGLYIDGIVAKAKEENADYVNLVPNTDEINDYYMFKFGHKTKFTNKPKSYISEEFNDFLIQLDRSKLKHRLKIALLLLEFNDDAISLLMKRIEQTKKSYLKDGELHDCSIYTHSFGGLGITFMAGINKQFLDFELFKFCNYKIKQHAPKTWMGLGDTSKNPSVFNFESMFLASSSPLSLLT